MTRTYKLENTWSVKFTVEHEGLVVMVDVSCLNGDRFDLEFSGQVKKSGCCDFGFGKPTMIHFCGRKDTDLFRLVFNDAMSIMRGEWN